MNHSTTYNRDILGRVQSVVDATGVTVTYNYDTFGRLWKITDPRLSSQIVYSYNDYDLVATISSPSGTTTFDYDPLTLRLRKVIDVLNRETRFEYDAITGDMLRTIKKMEDGSELTTHYSYNRFERIESVIPPDAHPITFQVDDIGRPIGSTETDGLVVGLPKAIDSNNADHGVWTNRVNHVFTWGAPDSDVGIVGYSFAQETVPDATVDTTIGTATWNAVADGQHTFQVRAKNTGTPGTWGDPAVFNLWIDTQPPQFSNWSLTPADVRGNTIGSAVVAVTVTDSLSGVTGKIPKLRWCTSKDSSRSWNSYAPMTALGNGRWSFNISATWANNQGKTLYYQVQAEDVAGNVADSGERTELIDVTDPPFILFTD